MGRQQLHARLDKTWIELTASYAGLSDAQMGTPGVTGDWSVKDILGHVTTWEEEALKYLPLIAQGGRPPRYSTTYGGVDAFNARMSEQKRALSVAEVLRQLADTHRQLVDYLQGLPDEHFTAGTRFQRRLRADTYSHYPIHARAIRQWASGQPAARA